MLGFSLSPGGLLLPYHIGALAALTYHGYISSSTPLAGASAGSIAVVAHATGIKPEKALDASIRVSSKCNPLFVAQGNIMPHLRHELDTLLDDDAHEIVNHREGMVGLAHRELFPSNRPVLQTSFETRNCLIDAICDSSMFPYFTTNKPFRIVKRRNKSIPRIVVDGIFSEPLFRFGCPDFKHATPIVENAKGVDRTVSILVVPHELTSLTTSKDTDKISPPIERNVVAQVTKLSRMATISSTKKQLFRLYEEGWADAERWVVQEEKKPINKKH